ncbi:hypothetical protein [Emcibacter sp.]|uniref:hypothetical protein n=1 Tax=Emcibacter sp. TaxID=1979954 RepID=UPI003A944F73
MEKEEKKVYLVANAVVEDPEEGINLSALVAPLKTLKWLVALITVLVFSLGLYMILGMPDEHAVQAKVMVAKPRFGDAGEIKIGGGLGGAASLLGLGQSTDADSARKMQILQSSVFIEKFIQDYDLLKIFFPRRWDERAGEWVKDDEGNIPTLRDGYEFFLLRVFVIEMDDANGVLNVTMKWRDPDTAGKWVRDYIAFANSYLRTEEMVKIEESIAYLDKQLEKTQIKERRDILFSLIEKEVYQMVSAKVDENFAFEIIDPAASISDIGKKRKMRLGVIAFILSFGAGLFGAYAFYFVSGKWRRVSV